MPRYVGRSYNVRMRYRLRTLMVLLAVGPPVLAGAWLLWMAGPEVWLIVGASSFFLLCVFGVAALWIVA